MDAILADLCGPFGKAEQREPQPQPNELPKTYAQVDYQRDEYGPSVGICEMYQGAPVRVLSEREYRRALGQAWRL